MKKLIAVTILILSIVCVFSACNTYHRCPAYTDIPSETSHCDKI